MLPSSFNLGLPNILLSLGFKIQNPLCVYITSLAYYMSSPFLHPWFSNPNPVPYHWSFYAKLCLIFYSPQFSQLNFYTHLLCLRFLPSSNSRTVFDCTRDGLTLKNFYVSAAAAGSGSHQPSSRISSVKHTEPRVLVNRVFCTSE